MYLSDIKFFFQNMVLNSSETCTAAFLCMVTPETKVEINTIYDNC